MVWARLVELAVFLWTSWAPLLWYSTSGLKTWVGCIGLAMFSDQVIELDPLELKTVWVNLSMFNEILIKYWHTVAFFRQMLRNLANWAVEILCRCDRILWIGKGIKQVSYKRADIRLSDHRPVSSNFLVEVEVLDHRKLKRALNVNSAAVHPEIFLLEEN